MKKYFKFIGDNISTTYNLDSFFCDIEIKGNAVENLMDAQKSHQLCRFRVDWFRKRKSNDFVFRYTQKCNSY